MVWWLHCFLFFFTVSATVVPVNHVVQSEFLMSEPLSMAIHGKSQVVGQQGLFHGLDGTLPYWIFESQSSPSDDPILIWIVNGNKISDIEAMALAVGPLSLTAGSVLTDNKHALNSNANVVLLGHPSEFDIVNASISDVLKAASTTTTFISLFTEKYPQYSYEQGVHLGSESFAARHIPIFAANLMTMVDRPVNISSIILGSAFIDPVTQYSSYFTASCVDSSIPLGPETCKLLNQSVSSLVPRIEKCQINPAFPFCNDLVLNLQQNTLGPVLSDVKNIYGFDINALGQSQLDVIEAFQSRERNGKVSMNTMFDLYRDPTYLLRLSTNELIQPYEYMVKYLLGAGIRVLVYSGANDMLYNPEGTRNWTSSLKWSKQKIPVTDGVISANNYRMGTGFVKGGLVFVNVRDSGHLVTIGNNKVFGNMLSSWCKNITFKCTVDVPTNSPSYSDLTYTTTSEYANPVVDLNIGVNVKATLEPIIITITSTVTEILDTTVSTVFETYFQTRTLIGENPEDTSASIISTTSPIPPATFTTTDTIFLLQPTTTTESFFRTLPPATVTITDITTVTPPSRITSVESFPVYTSTTEATVFTIETVSVAPVDMSAFYGSQTQVETPETLPNSALFTSVTVVTELNPSVPVTEGISPILTQSITAVPVLYSSFTPKSIIIPVNSDQSALSAFLPNAASSSMGMPTLALQTSMKSSTPSSFEAANTLLSNVAQNSQSGDDQTTTIFTTDAIFSVIPNTLLNPTITGVPFDSVPIESTGSVGISPITSNPPLDDPEQTEEISQWSPGRGDFGFGDLHPAPAPISQPTQLIGPEAIEGHQRVPDNVLERQQQLDAVAPVVNLPHPNSNDESHPDQGFIDDNLFNRPKYEDRDEVDWEYNDHSWDDWHHDDQDSDNWDPDAKRNDDYDDDDDDNDDDDNDEEEDDDDDEYYRSQLLDRISEHIDYAVNRIENGLDISSDSLEQGMDSTVDAVEDVMDQLENGLDHAMKSLRRFGRMY